MFNSRAIAASVLSVCMLAPFVGAQTASVEAAPINAMCPIGKEPIVPSAGTVEYKGEWMSDRKHGVGMFEDAEVVYRGEFFNDHFHGHGVWTTRGRTYEGEFHEGGAPHLHRGNHRPGGMTSLAISGFALLCEGA